MPPTARDYGWFFDAPDALGDLATAYCLTYVRSVTPEELLTRAGVPRISSYSGLTDLFDPAYNAWDGPGDGPLLLAALPLDGWSVGVEVNGYLGITPELTATLSRGTELVAHYYSGGNGFAQFVHAVDGGVRVWFEPPSPQHRHGSEPDSLLELMLEVGFDLREHLPEERSFDPRRCAFALAERVAGVQVTATQLLNGRYLAGLAPVPGRLNLPVPNEADP